MSSRSPHTLQQHREDFAHLVAHPEARYPLIKCCGMVRAADIDAVNTAKPDFCGFVVEVPSSSRNLSLEKALELHALVDEDIFTVAVITNPFAELLEALCNGNAALDILQLHGGQTNEQVAAIKTLTDAPLIHAITVRTQADIEQAADSPADLVLVDSGAGSGQTFDWSLLAYLQRPYLLAGGLNPNNIHNALATTHAWGIDISSGLETDKHKDPAKIVAAVNAVREFSAPRKGNNKVACHASSKTPATNQSVANVADTDV